MQNEHASTFRFNYAPSVCHDLDDGKQHAIGLPTPILGVLQAKFHFSREGLDNLRKLVTSVDTPSFSDLLQGSWNGRGRGVAGEEEGVGHEEEVNALYSGAVH